MVILRKKKGRLTLPARASVAYTLSAAAERGLAFIFTPGFTRILTPGEFGVYPLYISWMGIVSAVITLEIGGNVIYRALRRFGGRDWDVVATAALLMILAFCPVLSAFIIFGSFFSAITNLPRVALIFLSLQVLSNGIVGLYLALCRYSYRYGAAVLVSLTLAVLNPTLSFLLIKLTRVRSFARIVAPLAVSLAVALPILVRAFFGGGRPSLKVARGLLTTSLPLLPHFAATTVIAQAGKIAVGLFGGEAELAKYSVVFSMGFVFSLVTGAINSALSPWINRKLTAGEGEKIYGTARCAFALLTVMTLMGLAYSPEGLAFLAPVEYRGALGAIYPISLSVLLTFLTILINAVMIYYGQGARVCSASIIAACFNVFLNFTLTRRFGYIAAAFTQLLTALLLLCINAAQLWRLGRDKAGGVLQKRGLDVRFYAQIFLAAALGTVLLFFLRSSLLARIFIFAALLLILIPTAVECFLLVREKEPDSIKKENKGA